MTYRVEFSEAAVKDLEDVDNSSREIVLKTIQRVSENPLPRSEGGYGWPLGNKRNRNLTNLLKIKMRGIGYRVVYQLERTDTSMKIIVIGVRSDEEVYRIASERLKKGF